MFDPTKPDRARFGSDPFGYSSLAWMRWAMILAQQGFPIDPTKPPTPQDLKDPILWLCQANALQEAAVVLVKNEPSFDKMPSSVRGMCDTQYCAVALMLIGYSLEICLKAMIIMRRGIEAYTASEKDYRHHELAELADFIPGLDETDQATLKVLTHFVYWAGRYPDPGTRHHSKVEEVFSLSEKHEISAKQLFELASRVMGHVKRLVQ